ncbi:hypothetical protein GCM10009092_37380 [Bowmanella denitrificans]|uniref:Fibronectin type-III domain-containing protein n=1 Tax=Bowmanella denitrificans TaxID=366582 RepID=A0ABP3HGX9_9ALTE
MHHSLFYHYLSMKLTARCVLVLGTLIPSLNVQASQAVGWQELPNTKLIDQCPENGFAGYNYDFKDRCRNIVAWSGGTFDELENKLYVWGGGHADYYGNELYTLDLDSQALLRITAPAEPQDTELKVSQSELAPHDGTQPNSRHNYDGVAFVEHKRKIWTFSGALAGTGDTDDATWHFDTSTNSWQRIEATGQVPRGNYNIVSAYDKSSGKVFLHNRYGLYSYEMTDEGGHYTKLNASYINSNMTAAIDHLNSKMLIIGKGMQVVFDISRDSTFQPIEIPRSGDSKIIDAIAPGLAFNSKDNKFYAWSGDGKVYAMDITEGAWQSVAYMNDPGPQVTNGTLGRFHYSPQDDKFVLYNSVYENGYTLSILNTEDLIPPEKPTHLSYTEPYKGALEVQWSKSVDNVGVAGYRVYINGEMIAEQFETIFKTMAFAPGEALQVQIRAIDSFGNESEPSETLQLQLSNAPATMRLGDCDKEPQLNGRGDIVFCESWDHENWWEGKGYLADPIIARPKPLEAAGVSRTTVVADNCISGSCLKVEMTKDITNSLSAYWPLKNANLAPQNIHLRYYMKLGDNFDANMCTLDGEVLAAGGKFPGLADLRTGADPVGQCGNGGARADGKNCWSMRAIYSDCYSRDGEACHTKPNGAVRFGSYLYHAAQLGTTGDAGFWDGDDYGQTRGTGGTCDSNSSNIYCGKGDGGVFERGFWYRIEMQVTMNTPGLNDGIIRGWVDGVLSYEKLNVNFRELGHDFLHNRLVWLNIYKGGVHGNCSTSNIYLDQMVIALDQPIGGIDSDTLMPPTLNLNVSTHEPASDNPFTVEWQAVNAEQCEATGVWEGRKDTAGSHTLLLDSSGYLRMDCVGQGGTAARQIAIEVDGIPIPPTSDETDIDPGTPTVQLTEPTNLVMTQLDETALVLGWDNFEEDQENIVSYNVYMLGTLIGQSTSKVYEHVNYISGVTAEYAVTAVNVDGFESPMSYPAIIDIPKRFGEPDSIVTLLPVADAMLHASTHKNQGQYENLEVSNIANSVLRFPLELIPQEETIVAATLSLYSTSEVGHNLIGIFATNKHWKESTVTKDNADTGVYWRYEKGDWIDANFNVQGGQAFRQITWADDDISNKQEIDVTELVQYLHANPEQDYGILLKLIQGNATKFASKEYENTQYWPKLTVSLAKLNAPESLSVVRINEDGYTLSWHNDNAPQSVDHYRVFLGGEQIGITTTTEFSSGHIIRGVDVEVQIQAVGIAGNLSAKSATLVMSGPDAVGADVILTSTDDALLTDSSGKNFGAVDSLEVSAIANSLLGFPIQAIGNISSVETATLVLYSLKEYGDIELEVMKVATEWDEESVTRTNATDDSYWLNELGDWIDKNGAPQGDTPFTSMFIVDDDHVGAIRLDITELVNQWLLEPNSNNGLLIKVKDENTFRFASREHSNQMLRPTLELNCAHLCNN